jgi:DNA repair protein RadC
VDIFHSLGIKVLDTLLWAEEATLPWRKKESMPDFCKDKANYEPIALGAIPVTEKRNRFQDTR